MVQNTTVKYFAKLNEMRKVCNVIFLYLSGILFILKYVCMYTDGNIYQISTLSPDS